MLSGASSSSATGSPAATQDQSQSQSKTSSAPKDRPCPFCHQLFTSSSLGRHLDLYIKEKNPKPPDGVHDVDEIRQMRGKITRRHARGLSSAVASGNTPNKGPTTQTAPGSATKTEPPEATKPQRTTQGNPNGFYNEERPAHPNLNKLDWQATGVINDIPPRNNGIDSRQDPRSSSVRVDSPTQQQAFQQQRQNTRETRASNHTSDFALKDVLRSIQVANNRLKRPHPFDFDFFALTFPAMCLRIQPPPTSLFSTIPSSGGNSWPLEPPNRMEFETVNRILRNRIKTYNSMFPVDELRQSRSKEELHQGLARAIEAQTDQYCKHLNSAFDQWRSLNTQEQDRIWNLEIMRAYVSSTKDHQATKRKFEEVEDKLEALKNKLQAVTQAQLIQRGGSESAHVHTIPVALARELAQVEDSIVDWDYDTIMEKYKSASPSSWDNRLSSAVWYGTPADPFFNAASGLAQMSTGNSQPLQGSLSQNPSASAKYDDLGVAIGHSRTNNDVEMNDN